MCFAVTGYDISKWLLSRSSKTLQALQGHGALVQLVTASCFNTGTAVPLRPTLTLLTEQFPLPATRQKGRSLLALQSLVLQQPAVTRFTQTQVLLGPREQTSDNASSCITRGGESRAHLPFSTAEAAQAAVLRPPCCAAPPGKPSTISREEKQPLQFPPLQRLPYISRLARSQPLEAVHFYDHTKRHAT